MTDWLARGVRWGGDVSAGARDFLQLTLPHIVEQALSLIEICRRSLVQHAGWHRRKGMGGEPVWYNPERKMFSKRTPPEVARILSMLPREWVEHCSQRCLPMLRHGETKGVTIPRQLVGCLLANMFLCTFSQTDPTRHALPTRTFRGLLGSRLPHDVARLRAVVHFFERSLERSLNGRIPAPPDIAVFLAEVAEFKLASKRECDTMLENVAKERVEQEEYFRYYAGKLEAAKRQRAAGRAQRAGLGTNATWDPPPGAPLSDLSRGSLRIWRQHCVRPAWKWEESISPLQQLQVLVTTVDTTTTGSGGAQATAHGATEEEELMSRSTLQVLSSSVVLGGSTLTANQDPAKVGVRGAKPVFLPTREEVHYGV